jgi:hypothetical protein
MGTLNRIILYIGLRELVDVFRPLEEGEKNDC